MYERLSVKVIQYETLSSYDAEMIGPTKNLNIKHMYDSVGFNVYDIITFNHSCLIEYVEIRVCHIFLQSSSIRVNLLKYLVVGF